MHYSSVSWQVTLLYFFSWNFLWFGEKKTIKVQNFRLLNAHVKFDQICTLIGSFCCNYIKFQLKKIVLKMTSIWWILTWSSGNLQIFTLISSLCTKHVKFDLKKSRGVIFHETEEWWKIWRKTELRLWKWYEKYGKFSPEHLKVSQLGFWKDPFIQSRKFTSLKSAEELCVMTTKNKSIFEKRSTCRFKFDMRNVTNCDPNTQKSRKLLL